MWTKELPHNETIAVNRTMQTKQYLYHFDVMKGIAIILVVMGHVMLFAFDINPSEPSKFIYFNMPLFFYISGFLAYKNFNTLNELGKRILQRGIILLFPYVIFLSLYEIFTKGTDWSPSIIYAGGQGYWFLYDLFIISTFFLVYEYLIQRVSNNMSYVTLWILPYVGLIALKTMQIGGSDFQAVISGFVNYYRYFLIGYLCKKYVSLNTFLFENKLVGALAFVAYFLNWYFFELHNMALIFFGTLGGIIVVQSFVKNYISSEGVIGKLLIYVGKCSLGIYVIHYFFYPRHFRYHRKLP